MVNNIIKLKNGAFVYKAPDFINSGDFYPKYKKYLKNIKNLENLENYTILRIPQGISLEELIDLEQLLGDLGPHFCPKSLIIFAEKFSSAKIYAKLLTDGFFEQILCFLEDCSSLDCTLFLVGDTDHNTRVKVTLLGQNAQANINGCYIASAEQQINLVTEQAHMCKNSQSKVIINGIVADDANFTYKAKINIEKNGAGSKVLQKNKNIIIGKNATVYATPQMEILHNKVACTHGCATGMLDTEKLFYLQSRGLKIAQAKKVLIHGLFDFLLHSIDNQIIKASVVKKINDNLGQIL